VFPVTALPDLFFPLLQPGRRDNDRNWQPIMPGKMALDQSPTDRKVRITWREGPEEMKMVGEDDTGNDGEGPLLYGRLKCVSQVFNSGRIRKNWAALKGDNGEEIGSTRNENAAVVHTILLVPRSVGLRAVGYRILRVLNNISID
jgi:hypothetical protein